MSYDESRREVQLLVSRLHWQRALAATAAAVFLFAFLGATGTARVVPVRTLLISNPPGKDSANAASANPVLAAGGRVVIFDTSATNLGPDDPNGDVRDVIRHDLRTGQSHIISAGGNGPSARPAASRSGQAVAFLSAASNLVEGDTNGVTDIFFRDAAGPIRPVSVAPDGSPANGPSWDPDISAGGQYVVFTSAATNLVDGDRNGQPDVFLHDILEGETIRLSVSSREVEGNGPSGAPAISADGRVVSFTSAASNLAAGDTNRVGDVFIRRVPPGRTARVSVSSGRQRQQNKAVAAPFIQISDISADGRYVVFDSDATNLVRRDANRRTDVFRHDRVTRRTELVSASTTNRQGNNDSVSPVITPNGRFVAFQSFAGNLAPGNVKGEDVFVRDLKIGATSIVNVPASGARRAPELVRQLLQRPAISESGTRVAFTSTARGLVDKDRNAFEDVFLRLLAPPRTLLATKPVRGSRPWFSITADDPLATRFVCQIDTGKRFLCQAGRFQLPDGLRKGRHEVGVRAGGVGMMFDPVGLKVSVLVDGDG